MAMFFFFVVFFLACMFSFPHCHAPWCSAICLNTATKFKASILQCHEKTNQGCFLHEWVKAKPAPAPPPNPDSMKTLTEIQYHALTCTLHANLAFCFYCARFPAKPSIQLINGALPSRGSVSCHEGSGNATALNYPPILSAMHVGDRRVAGFSLFLPHFH